MVEQVSADEEQQNYNGASWLRVSGWFAGGKGICRECIAEKILIHHSQPFDDPASGGLKCPDIMTPGRVPLE
jgi:hypothetical protein